MKLNSRQDQCRKGNKWIDTAQCCYKCEHAQQKLDQAQQCLTVWCTTDRTMPTTLQYGFMLHVPFNTAITLAHSLYLNWVNITQQAVPMVESKDNITSLGWMCMGRPRVQCSYPAKTRAWYPHSKHGCKACAMTTFTKPNQSSNVFHLLDRVGIARPK